MGNAAVMPLRSATRAAGYPLRTPVPRQAHERERAGRARNKEDRQEMSQPLNAWEFQQIAPAVVVPGRHDGTFTLVAPASLT